MHTSRATEAEPTRTAVVRVDNPLAEPVTLAEAKLQCREDGDEQDTYILQLVAAAREYAEDRIGRSLITQTWRLHLDRFPCDRHQAIELPRGPLQSVVSVKYVDPDGQKKTLDPAAYQVDGASAPARIAPAAGMEWPATAECDLNAVVVEFRTGHGNTGVQVPARARQAILLLVGHWFANREAVTTGTIVTRTPLAVDALLEQCRATWL